MRKRTRPLLALAVMLVSVGTLPADANHTCVSTLTWSDPSGDAFSPTGTAFKTAGQFKDGLDIRSISVTTTGREAGTVSLSITTEDPIGAPPPESFAIGYRATFYTDPAPGATSHVNGQMLAIDLVRHFDGTRTAYASFRDPLQGQEGLSYVTASGNWVASNGGRTASVTFDKSVFSTGIDRNLPQDVSLPTSPTVPGWLVHRARWGQHAASAWQFLSVVYLGGPHSVVETVSTPIGNIVVNSRRAAASPTADIFPEAGRDQQRIC